jgi:hypothetical protein
VPESAIKDADKQHYNFLVFADSNNIYAFEAALSTPVIKIGSGFTNIVNLDSDLENGYLFVADQSSDGTSTTIKRYTMTTNYNDTNNPYVILNTTTLETPYSGAPITGLCADDSNEQLLFAVPSTKTIYNNDYTEDTLETLNNTIGSLEAIY